MSADYDVTPLPGPSLHVRDLGGNSPTPTTPVVAGVPGLSAYEVAVRNGFVGTVEEWLDSLVGPEGGSSPTISDPTIATYVREPEYETHTAVVEVVHFEVTPPIDPVILFENALI